MEFWLAAQAVLGTEWGEPKSGEAPFRHIGRVRRQSALALSFRCSSGPSGQFLPASNAWQGWPHAHCNTDHWPPGRRTAFTAGGWTNGG